MDNDKKLALVTRYHAALHAMQTGVEYKRQYDPGETQPKHLRVGVNSALSSQEALASLLVSKGIITEEEYMTAVADQMEVEAESYRKELSERFGVNITLG